MLRCSFIKEFHILVIGSANTPKSNFWNPVNFHEMGGRMTKQLPFHQLRDGLGTKISKKSLKFSFSSIPLLRSNLSLCSKSSLPRFSFFSLFYFCFLFPFLLFFTFFFLFFFSWVVSLSPISFFLSIIFLAYKFLSVNNESLLPS